MAEQTSNSSLSIPIIYLEWCDAISDGSGWMSFFKAKEWGNNEDWVIRQVGFLLNETEEYLLLAGRVNPHNVTEDDLKVDGLLKIPKTWVRKRIDLSESIVVS
ncbi:MAG: hypothetical protein U0U70_10920 [Chitinophagaceae bacterium]